MLTDRSQIEKLQSEKNDNDSQTAEYKLLTALEYKNSKIESLERSLLKLEEEN